MLKANFIYTGYKEFTKQGYQKAAANFDNINNGILKTNDHILITGSNSGIGFASAQKLAQQGAHVHLACRNATRAEAAKNQILEEDAHAKAESRVSTHILDISDLASIKKFVEDLNEKKIQINTLVNNAGCMVHGSNMEKRVCAKNGYEVNCATNTLGTYLLTKYFLDDQMQKQSLKKVITVSSGGMYTEKLKPDYGMEKNPKIPCSDFPKDATQVYAQNKRQQVVFMEELQALQKYKDQNVFFATMHPGWADTNAVRVAMPDFYEKFEGKWRSPEEGADTICYLATQNFDKDTQNGKFWLDRSVKPTHLTMDFFGPASKADRSKFMENLNKIADEFGN